jgi:hypothetical protein
MSWRLDLADIDAQIANRHPCRQFPGIIGMQGDLTAHGACGGLRGVKDTFVAFARASALRR